MQMQLLHWADAYNALQRYGGRVWGGGGVNIRLSFQNSKHLIINTKQLRTTNSFCKHPNEKHIQFEKKFLPLIHLATSRLWLTQFHYICIGICCMGLMPNKKGIWDYVFVCVHLYACMYVNMHVCISFLYVALNLEPIIGTKCRKYSWTIE